MPAHITGFGPQVLCDLVALRFVGLNSAFFLLLVGRLICYITIVAGNGVLPCML